jgi:CheY-like chemotaxis protein
LPAGTTREGEDILDRIRPAAIILDIVLRSEHTWAFLARLKQDRRTSGIPVLIASTIEDQAKAYHLGADRYLVKPIERPQLVRELKALTGSQPEYRVLIIDDEERDRYILRQKLNALPLAITEAHTGNEGVRMACNDNPNLIFLDLGMPDLSGFEVLEKLKSPTVAEIPVIIVTSRILADSERTELMRRAIAIVGKQDLEQANLGELLKFAMNGTVRGPSAG